MRFSPTHRVTITDAAEATILRVRVIGESGFARGDATDAPSLRKRNGAWFYGTRMAGSAHSIDGPVAISEDEAALLVVLFENGWTEVEPDRFRRGAFDVAMNTHPQSPSVFAWTIERGRRTGVLFNQATRWVLETSRELDIRERVAK